MRSAVEKVTIDWREFAVTPSDGSKIILVHTVLWTDDFQKVIVVLNREEQENTKPRGWGIPSGKVIRPSKDGRTPSRTPLEQARLEIIHEINLDEKDFKIHRIPVDARVTPQNGRFHLLFTGVLEPYTDVPLNPVDPDGDILEAALMNPDQEIDQGPSSPQFRGDVFYRSHLRNIFTARNRFPTGEILM